MPSVRLLPPLTLVVAPLALGTFWACVPAGNAPPYDAGPTSATLASAAPQPKRPAVVSPPLGKVFEDNFERTASRVDASTPTSALSAAAGDASIDAAKDAKDTKEGGAVATGEAGLAAVASQVASANRANAANTTDTGELGPDWIVVPGSSAWRIDQGKLCGRNARNKGVWLNRTLPVNARIEFDAMSDSPEGDLKAEVWGDGQTGATAISYTNATSYLVIFGGWKNTLHVLARLNEHGTDRKEIQVKASTDEFRERAVAHGQTYRFKIERSDGKTIRWWVNDVEMLSFEDPSPLTGTTHDHFGFNNWQVRVCFDNVRVTAL